MCVCRVSRARRGAIGTTARDIEFEKLAGYALEIDGGLAEVQALGYKRFAVYYETTHVDADTNLPYKVKHWIINAEIGKTNESHATNQASPTFAEYSYPIRVYGSSCKTLAEAGEAYVDENGNKIVVLRVSAYPGDENYDDFGDEVPTPVAKAGESGGGGGQT